MIEKIDIEFSAHGNFLKSKVDGIYHEKILPQLSVVQATEGSYDISLNGGKSFNTGEGGFFIAPANSVQAITHNANAESGVMTARWIFLKIKINDLYLLDNMFEFPAVLPKEKQGEMNALFDEIFDEDATLCDKYSAYYKVIKILLSVATENSVHTDSRILSAYIYIRKNYKSAVSVFDLAKNSGMSEANFYKMFKKHTGYSPIRYLNNYRLSLAANILLNTKKSVKEISESVGIFDSVYFNKIFKQAYQMPPKEYRKIYSNN